LILFAAAADAAKLPKLTFNYPNSSYRVIDKTGDKSNKALWDWVIPEIGVGNIIFGKGSLPVGDESEYAGRVGAEFNLSDIKDDFTCRAYYPARQQELIDWILAKYPKYTFVKRWSQWKWFFEGEEGETYPVREPDPNDTTGAWDQNSFYIMPENERTMYKGQDWASRVAKEPAGSVTELYASVWLQFKTGTERKVSKWVGDELVTEWVPNVRDVLISEGSCKIKNQ